MSLFNCAVRQSGRCVIHGIYRVWKVIAIMRHALWCICPFVSSRRNREQVISCCHRRTSFAFHKTYVQPRMYGFECVTPNGKFHEIYQTNSRAPGVRGVTSISRSRDSVNDSFFQILNALWNARERLTERYLSCYLLNYLYNKIILMKIS